MSPSGPLSARIMLIGEAPGEEELRKGEPFVGASGYELTNMLRDAGLDRSQCFLTNVCHERPFRNDLVWTPKNPTGWIADRKSAPDGGDWVRYRDRWVRPNIVRGIERLAKEISLVKPNLIIGFGNLPLFVLYGKWGIGDWRGSQLRSTLGDHNALFLPTYHPAAVLRQYDWRFAAVHDLRRAKRYLAEGYNPPEYSFLVRPSFAQTLERLAALSLLADGSSLLLAVDIETRGRTACVGLAWSKLDAICIPFMCIEDKRGYWSLEEEATIVLALSKLLQHPNVRCVGQNFLYDVQHLFRDFHFIPRFYSDTMLAHHVCFPGLPKGLDFLSALYCAWHVYWKSESKDWHKSMQEDELWTYNCKDCVITYEVHEEIANSVEQLGLQEPYAHQMKLWHSALKAMLRGLRVDMPRRAKVRAEIVAAINEANSEIAHIIGHEVNIRSTQQLQRLFYSDLGVKPVLNRKTKQPSTDDDALTTILSREPILSPLISRIRALRSLGVFLSTFVEAKPDVFDGRMRCFFNPAGTETFRFSSSQDAFDSGMNLQNLSKGEEE